MVRNGAVRAWCRRCLGAKVADLACADCGRTDGIHIFALNLIAPQMWKKSEIEWRWRLRYRCCFGMGVGRNGLVLAIPITATLRVICDHTECEADWKMAERIALRYSGCISK